MRLSEVSGIFVLSFLFASTLLAQKPTSADYPSIQEAIDANPGLMIFVPAGDHVIHEHIFIKHGGGLYGPGKIIQTNPEQPILRVERGNGVQIRDLTLTRSEGQMDTAQEGVLVRKCHETTLQNLRIIDNRTVSASIQVRESQGTQILGCRVENYMRINVDDRTQSPLYGYAFRCIDGTGIDIEHCQGTLIQDCRVVEHNLHPTPEMKEKYGLGKFVKKNPQKGTLMSQEVWDAEYVNNWHQGSGIVINSPLDTTRTLLIGNQVENAAQGLDLHCDQVTVSNNIITNSFMGMKAMHGSRNVLIIGNQFIRNDLWSIGLMPGTSSNASQPANGDAPAKVANVDGGSIIANNIISDFGYGDSAWIWGHDGLDNSHAFRSRPASGKPSADRCDRAG